jgi:hypothetical protein
MHARAPRAACNAAVGSITGRTRHQPLAEFEKDGGGARRNPTHRGGTSEVVTSLGAPSGVTGPLP